MAVGADGWRLPIATTQNCLDLCSRNLARSAADLPRLTGAGHQWLDSLVVPFRVTAAGLDIAQCHASDCREI